MNLPSITNNPLTIASTSATPLAGVASDPLSQLVSLGKSPVRGVEQTRQFEQTLASALAEILSKTSISGNSDNLDSSDSSIVPDFTSTMMPLSLSLTLGQLNSLNNIVQLPKASQDNNTTQSGGTGGAV